MIIPNRWCLLPPAGKRPEHQRRSIGIQPTKISFCVVLNEDGTLHDIIPEDDGNADKPRPKLLIVPGGAKPSGSGINPCFLWDNTGYMLGYKPDDDKPERTLQTFEAFRVRHLELRESIDDPEFDAVCTFLSKWNPESATDHTTLKETSTGFGVFRIRERTHYVHERDAVRSWWVSQPIGGDDGSAVRGQCLLTGDVATLARLHEPKIKGVAGAQSSGASLVSFNDSAYHSFGRSQSYNAPVSESAAFQYGTALNYLLRSESGRRIQIGDATTVFWTESPSPAEELFSFVADPSCVSAEDEVQKDRIRSILRHIADGASAKDLELGDGDTPFYVLGLSPNAARLSVRFWYVSTLRDLVNAIRQHFHDLDIVRSARDPEFPAVWQLLRETAREPKDIPPLLGGAVMRAVLNGTAYPQMLFAAVIRRFGLTAKFGRRRNSQGVPQPEILDSTFPHFAKEIPVALDPDRPEPAYQLGRLFAELEKTQEDALPEINATIKDRYFSAASATPGSVFPRIIRMSQHHLSKLGTEGSGSKVHHEKQIQEICGRVDSFPSHLNLNDQGLFALGYYHHRQNIFTKKQNPNFD